MMIIFMMAIESDDDRAFIESIYKEYYPIMKHKALSIVHNKQTAEDMVNDAVVKLIDKIDVLRSLNTNCMVSYMVYTVRNISLNHMKRQGKIGYFSDTEEYMREHPDEEKSPEIVFIRNENREQLYDALQKLAEQDRMLLVNKYFMRQSDKQLSELTGIKENNVRAYIARARRKVMAALRSMEGAK